MPPVYAIISFLSYRFFRSYTCVSSFLTPSVLIPELSIRRYYELVEVGALFPPPHSPSPVVIRLTSPSELSSLRIHHLICFPVSHAFQYTARRIPGSLNICTFSSTSAYCSSNMLLQVPLDILRKPLSHGRISDLSHFPCVASASDLPSPHLCMLSRCCQIFSPILLLKNFSRNADYGTSIVFTCL
jgi:hypothetical protein